MLVFKFVLVSFVFRESLISNEYLVIVLKAIFISEFRYRAINLITPRVKKKHFTRVCYSAVRGKGRWMLRLGHYFTRRNVCLVSVCCLIFVNIIVLLLLLSISFVFVNLSRSIEAAIENN